MGVMNFLRERMGRIVAIVIGISLFAFIVGEVLRQGSSFFHGDRDAIGEVSGEKISYKDFEQQLDNAKKQSGQADVSGQFAAYLQEMVWNQQVSRIILNKEIDKLGLVVSPTEAGEMVNGNNPDPQIVQYFGDPKTGQVDRTKLNAFEQNMAHAKADDPTKQQWELFIKQLSDNKLGQKYISIATNGLYVNSLDAMDDYSNRNKLANFKYVTLDYASIPDNKVNPTDDDYQSYYDEHKSQFKNKEETRSFDYVSFNAAPSKEDSAVIKASVEKLIPALKSSTNDSLFVQINADTKAPLSFKKKGALGDPKLDSIMFNEANGFVYGPYVSNGSYKIAKLVDSKVGPDSVKARHILIQPGAGGMAGAQAKADSLKKLIQSGKGNFADLAKTFSADKGSAEKGGELGYFGRGAMVPQFENAAFAGKKGDLKTVASQFGVHLIEIEDQKGSSKVAEVAVVDKAITPSSKTQTIAYSAAQKFLGSLSKGNFDAEVKKEGLTKKTANDVTALASSFQGVDNARDLVRWAYKADKGDFGDQVYEAGNQYIVPVLTEIKPKGILPLEAVKKQIESAVRNQVKARQLIAKLQEAEHGASTIDQVAQKAGAKVVPVQNVVFGNPVIPGLSLEYKVVGTIFGSKPNKLSKPIQGEHGVYVFTLDNFIGPAQLANAVREKTQLQQTISQRSQGLIFDALKDKADVKDYRAKFL
jgi:peptidyl-prolyl cis-trans isomerase D